MGGGGGGTPSAPGFKLDPTAVAGLLESGIGGALNDGSADKRDAKPPIKPSKKELLDRVLRDALDSGKPHQEHLGSGCANRAQVVLDRGQRGVETLH